MSDKKIILRYSTKQEELEKAFKKKPPVTTKQSIKDRWSFPLVDLVERVERGELSWENLI